VKRWFASRRRNGRARTSAKKANDDFLAALEPDQRQALGEDGFDMLSRIDPMVLLRMMPPTQPGPQP
jgi:hypothetical protein